MSTGFTLDITSQQLSSPDVRDSLASLLSLLTSSSSSRVTIVIDSESIASVPVLSATGKLLTSLSKTTETPKEVEELTFGEAICKSLDEHGYSSSETKEYLFSLGVDLDEKSNSKLVGSMIKVVMNVSGLMKIKESISLVVMSLLNTVRTSNIPDGYLSDVISKGIEESGLPDSQTRAYLFSLGIDIDEKCNDSLLTGLGSVISGLPLNVDTANTPADLLSVMLTILGKSATKKI